MRRASFRKLTIVMVLTLFNLPFLAGCGGPRGDIETFNRYFAAADCNNSTEFAQSKISERANPSGEDLLWTLQLACAQRLCRDYSLSTASFDKAEDMLKHYDEQLKLGDTVGSAIVNENVIPYRGEEYDAVLVNTYKALNFIAVGDYDLARVEFNRALDRQRRARENFNAEIRKLEKEIENRKNKTYDVKAAVDDPNTFALIEQKYPSLTQFEAYPDFVNPFATYMAGLFFNLVGDHDKAAYLLKESYGMVPDNPYLSEDLLLTDDVLAGKQRFENLVWVIFENGLGPVKEEFRIDLPLFLVTNKIRYIGIALPKLRLRDQAYPYLTVKTETDSRQTAILADMDRVIQTEFSKDFKAILTRSLISATAKAVAQYALEDNDSSLAAAFMAIYNYATTAADLRIWTALPKDFQLARCQMPKNHKLAITAPGCISFDIIIPECKNAVVYVKIIQPGSEPICEVLAF